MGRALSPAFSSLSYLWLGVRSDVVSPHIIDLLTWILRVNLEAEFLVCYLRVPFSDALSYLPVWERLGLRCVMNSKRPRFWRAILTFMTFCTFGFRTNEAIREGSVSGLRADQVGFGHASPLLRFGATSGPGGKDLGLDLGSCGRYDLGYPVLWLLGRCSAAGG